MAVDVPKINGAASLPIQVAFPIPRAPQTNIHLSLTVNKKSLLLFLTSAPVGESARTAALGSFVYALPNRLNPTAPLSTPLYSNESTLEFTVRFAKLLARKAEIPVYVSNSIQFGQAGWSGSMVEEESEAFRRIMDVVLGLVEAREKQGVNVG